MSIGIEMMMKTFAMAGAVALLGATSSLASTVSGTFDGSIAAPTGSGVTHTTGGQGSLYWGTPAWNEALDESDASSLRVNDAPFSHVITGAGEFLLGTLTWTNHSSWNTGPEWSSSLTLNVDFDAPLDLASLSETINFTLLNTTDVHYDTDANEAEGNNADKINNLVLGDGAFNVPLALGGDLVLTEVFFKLEDAGTSGSLFDFDGSGSRYDSSTGRWENREGGVSTIGVYGAISPVPLPAGVWLMLGGIGGLAALKRRAKKHQAA